MNTVVSNAECLGKLKSDVTLYKFTLSQVKYTFSERKFDKESKYALSFAAGLIVKMFWFKMC